MVSFQKNPQYAGADNTGSDTGKQPLCEPSNAELKKRLEFAEKKLQIVGSVTRHDVLNQLTAVIGYNELLGMMVEDPKQKSFLEKERQAMEKIRRQFQFSKDYQNIGVEPPRWQMLKNIVRRMSEEVDLPAMCVTDLTGDASVYADPLFEKVFSNLFENTLRYGGENFKIRISISKDNTGAAVLVVEDTGTGIPADEKSRIFERGYGKNTGWGLFLIREILDITGMTITETGEPCKGARFEICIPQDNFRLEGGEPQASATQSGS